MPENQVEIGKTNSETLGNRGRIKAVQQHTEKPRKQRGPRWDEPQCQHFFVLEIEKE